MVDSTYEISLVMSMGIRFELAPKAGPNPSPSDVDGIQKADYSSGHKAFFVNRFQFRQNRSADLKKNMNRNTNAGAASLMFRGHEFRSYNTS